MFSNEFFVHQTLVTRRTPSGSFMILDILAFSLTGWFQDALTEFTRYFSTMNVTQWGIVSACAVFFGFLCLRGTGLRV
jgi:hypothetical protein